MLKRHLTGLAVAGLAMLTMSACVSADGGVKQFTDSDKFAAICSTEPVVHAAFTVIAFQNNLKASTIEAEAAAHAIVASVCANPPADVSQALFAAADAYARVLALNATAAEKESG